MRDMYDHFWFFFLVAKGFWRSWHQSLNKWIVRFDLGRLLALPVQSVYGLLVPLCLPFFFAYLCLVSVSPLHDTPSIHEDMSNI